MFVMTNAPFDRVNARRISAPAVRKALRVLDLVASERGAGISEIARRTELSKSTVHGLVAALLDEGALAPGNDGLVLGPRLVALATFARDTRVLQAGQDVVCQLANKTGETALFGRADGEDVTILARADGARTVTVSAPIGARVPLSARALAGPSARRLAAKRNRNSPPSFTIDRGEYVPGIAGIAAAVEWRETAYFIWIVSLDALHDDATLQCLGEATAAAAADFLLRVIGSRTAADVEGSAS